MSVMGVAECKQLGLWSGVDHYSQLLAEMERDFRSTASRMISDVLKHSQDIADASERPAVRPKSQLRDSKITKQCLPAR
jgi:hypothetical protein